MNSRKLLAAALTATLTSGMIATLTTSAFAADNQPAATTASAGDQALNKVADKDLVKVSEDTQTSMRDVHSARLAIFNGQPDEARTYVDAAVTRMDAAVKDADKYALDIKAPKSEDNYVPFDASLAVMNTFQPTAENSKHIAKAKAQLQKGDKRAAIESLKLAEIDVAVTASMIPVKFAREHIDQAAKLVAEHKYYDANMALKAVDDAVVVDTYAIDALPKTKANANS